MAQTQNTSTNLKKKRLKIKNIDDFKKALIKEGYKNTDLEDNALKVNIAKDFEIDDLVIDMIYDLLGENDITYRADNITNFIEYIKNIKEFKYEHDMLSKKINKINTLIIDRVEYERIMTTQDDVSHMIEDIERIKNEVSKRINQEDIYKLENIEKQLDENYVYAKDIELLKKMVKTEIKEDGYNEKTRVKTISIEVPNEMNHEYIPAQIGSIEYHQHIKNNIPRMKRLRKNIKNYMKVIDDEHQIIGINQSETLNDTINIAVAVFDDKEYKAISGSNEVEEFCTSPKEKDAIFTSSKVNKLGKLGIGYNRVNDSEKKILEEIHNQIELGNLKSHGNLVLYSKWEPCPSCYYVISQFLKKYPDINVEVRYSKKYGE